jgi:type VI secretion system protein ImpA
MSDPSELLAPVSDDAPCGPDLEYDPAFLELETLSRGKPEQQFGDTLIAAEPPDWPKVRERASELLARSKDLRVALLWLRAATCVDGVAGFEAGMRLLIGLVNDYWDGLHPALDADEDDDPTYRLNALAPFSDPDMVPRDFRAAWVGRARAVGQVTVREIEIAAGRLQPREGENVISEVQLDAILSASAKETPEALAAAQELPERIKEFSRLMADKVGSERAPSLASLLQSAQVVQAACRRAVGEPEQAGDEEGGEAAGEPGSAPVRVAAGQIASREDAMRMLDKVCDYLARTEPTNPAPLLIRRAKVLMGKSFLEIIRDLAPDSLAQVHNIAGTPPDERD